MRDNKLTYDQIIDYAAGRGSAEERAAVAARLADDPERAATARLLTRAFAVARSDDSVAPPESTLAAAKALFRERRARAAPPALLAGLRQMLAALVFDSRAAGALAGVRGSGAVYQLAFESEVADVDLEVAAAGAEMRQLRGQVTAHDDATIQGIAVVAKGAPDVSTTVAPDARGTFVVTVKPGRYDLYITIGETKLVVSDLEIA